MTKTRVSTFLVFTFLAQLAFPCSYIGDPPSIDDLLNDLANRSNNYDLIFRASIEVKGKRTLLHIKEDFKGTANEVIDYQQPTSCDQYFEDDVDDAIIFAWYFNDRLHISDSIGAIESKHVRFQEALRTLRAMSFN